MTGGNAYQHHQSVAVMITAFAEAINTENDEDIQNCPVIVILADESVNIAVYKKLDIYISLVKNNEPSTRFAENRNVPESKAENI